MRAAVLALSAILVASGSQADRASFTDFLAAIRSDAIGRGIRPEILDEALKLDEPVPVILERDRSQAEVILPFDKYLIRRLTPKVITSAQQTYHDQQKLLAAVASHYGVPPRIIVAVWGVESHFGRYTGVHPTVAALATLAWDPRRSSLFRTELLDALEILNRGDISLSDMRGSWAGAMGQVQFLPSSYLKFAEDFNGDGRRDIWGTPADVFASIANYLKGHGWEQEHTWGREVKVPLAAARKIADEVPRRQGACHAIRMMSIAQPVAEWRKLGVRTLGGTPLPDSLPDASLVSGATRHFLVYENYDALLAYNCAHAYAISVGLLADRIH